MALEPLPEEGPTTLVLVKAYLKIADAVDDAAIAAVVDAVNDFVRDLPTADRSRGLDAWKGKTVQGATMLAARLHRRRDTPDGVAAFGDAGAVYVQRNDPDIGILLNLGTSRIPAVG